MSVAALVARGRAAAENKLMIDACVVRRRTGSSTGAGGVVTSTWSTVYTGKCRLKVDSKSQAGQMSDIGEAARVVTRRTLQIPVTAVGLLEADQVTITASTLDPGLVGNVYAVRVVPEASTLTRRDVVLVEVTS